MDNRRGLEFKGGVHERNIVRVVLRYPPYRNLQIPKYLIGSLFRINLKRFEARVSESLLKTLGNAVLN
jgi:hypothetical protein